MDEGDQHEPDAEHFAGLMQAHHRQVLAYAIRRLGSRQAAEDLAADTFLVAWRRLAHVPPEPLPWLYKTARGLLLNERRKSVRRFRAEHRAGDPVQPVDPGARVVEADRLHRALAALTESDRELLMLVGWEGLDVGDAARVLGAPAPVVSVRLYRARRRLSRQLAEHDEPGPAAAPDESLATEWRSA
jgi:RNA polymerase sigma-70 factor (ECF subfamily)